MAERNTAILPSFNAGELSPRLAGRVDQSVYGIGCSEMVGWLPLVEGCAVAAPGSYFIEAAKGPSRLIPFEYNPTQGYVIEASNLAFRFFTNNGRIETSPGTAYEVAHPYSHAELLTLDYQQSADVLYLAGGGRQQRKLSRTGAETFTITTLDLTDGPIGDGNSDQAKTIQASATTGSVTLTASSAIFVLTDVGSLIELEAADFNDVPSWEPGIQISTGNKRTWDGKVYSCTDTAGTGRTGTIPPSHDTGTEWDGSSTGTDINAKGPYGVQWTFLYGRFGLAKITAFTDTTHVTATVVKQLADSLVTTASWRWSFGAFSDTRGWPEAVCEWNETLVFARGSDIYVSVVGDFENFASRDSSGDFQRDLAAHIRIPHGGQIRWMVADENLIVGTTVGEFPIQRVQIQTGTAGPPVFQIGKPSKDRVAAIKPLETGTKLLFVQAAQKKILELGYQINSDRYEAPDLTRLAEHIGKKLFLELAWQQEPEQTVWAVRGDGTLAALAYSPNQQVMGWSRRELGAGLAARSICNITDPTGTRDQVWIAAEVVSGPGAGQWWVMLMQKVWETGDDQTDAVYLDAAFSYAGAAAASGTGATHLAGRTVQVLADGKAHPDIVIGGGGAWSISFAAEKVTMGLPYAARLTPMRIEGGQSEGTAQGKRKRVSGLTLRLLDSQGLQVTVQDLDPYPVETRVPGDAMDQAVPLFTGDVELDVGGDFDRDGLITIERYQPMPATIVALIPAFQVGER